MQRLKLSDAEVIALLKRLPGMLLLVSRSGEIIFSNLTFDSLPSTNQAIILRACQKVLQTGASFTFEMSGAESEEAETKYACEVEALGDSNGMSIAAAALSMRAYCERSYSLVSATLEATADGILVVDKNENITGYNRVFLDLWKIPRERIERRGYKWALDFVLDQLTSPQHCLEKLQEIAAKPDRETHDILEFKDGRVFERYSRPQKIGNQIVGRVFSYRDITDRIVAEKNIQKYASQLKLLADISRRSAEARFDLNAVLEVTVRSIAEHFGDGCIVRLYSEDQSSFAPPAFYHVLPEIHQRMSLLFPNTRTFMFEKEAVGVLATGDPAMGTAQSPREARALVSPEYWPMYDFFPVYGWMIVPLRMAARVVGLVTVFRCRRKPQYSNDDLIFLQELSDRIALTVENARLYLNAQEAVQLRDEFILIASHELRTPLTPLKMQLQLLSNYLNMKTVPIAGAAEKLQKLIADSDHQINRLTRLVEDMLDVSRLQTGRLTLSLEETDLSRLASEAVERFRHQLASANCPIVSHITPGVYGDLDKLRIEQVISNLLSNAMKYGAGKPIQLAVSVEDGHAILTVQDFGIGIAEKDHARIFERYGRAVSVKNFGGLGVGLYITRQIVESHGGQVFVKSSPGQGTLFTVRLPLGIRKRESKAA